MECLKLSTNCTKGPHGPIGSWDVSAMIDTSSLFVDANNKAIPGATKFNGDISNWDVSSVSSTDGMFQHASSFKRTLCDKWETSTAKKDKMFDGSGGKFCG